MARRTRKSTTTSDGATGPVEGSVRDGAPPVTGDGGGGDADATIGDAVVVDTEPTGSNDRVAKDGPTPDDAAPEDAEAAPADDAETPRATEAPAVGLSDGDETPPAVEERADERAGDGAGSSVPEVARTATAVPSAATLPEREDPRAGEGTADAPAAGATGPMPEDVADLRGAEPREGPAATDGERRPEAGTAAPPPPGRSGGFVPLLLGGLLAGAIGYAVPTFLLDDDAPVVDISRIDTLEARMAELAGVEPPDLPEVDLSGVEGAQADLSADIAGLADRIARLEEAGPSQALVALRGEVETALADLDALSDGLGGTAADRAALRDDLTARDETLRAEFEALRADLTSQAEALGTDLTSGDETLRSDLTGRLDDLAVGLSEAQAQAASVEDEAEALARQAARNQIALALESGAPYADQVEILGDVPAPLAASAEAGVPTAASLAADFPPLAREALRAARAEEEAGMGSLFRNAFSPRSLEPQEGSDPDAVLSRAEAEMRAGDAAAALAEIETLPEAVAAPLADWRARARTRVDAVAAADGYLKDE